MLCISGQVLWMTWMLQLFFLPSRGTVHQLHSTISAVQRTHGCKGELLSFTCNTTGEWMEWKGIDELSLRFLFTHPINKVLTHTNITAILVDKVDNGAGRNVTFTSVIFIKLTDSTLPSNITCSSSTDEDTLTFSVAKLPQKPGSVNITRLGVGDTSIQYYIKWSVPCNSEEFDLDHYEITVGNNITYIDGNENEAIISIRKETLKSAVAVNVVAMDECGKKSKKRTAMLHDLVSGGVVGKNTSASSCTCTKVISISVIIPCFILLLIIVILSFIMIYIVLKMRNSSPPLQLLSLEKTLDSQQRVTDKSNERYFEMEKFPQRKGIDENHTDNAKQAVNGSEAINNVTDTCTIGHEKNEQDTKSGRNSDNVQIQEKKDIKKNIKGEDTETPPDSQMHPKVSTVSSASNLDDEESSLIQTQDLETCGAIEASGKPKVSRMSKSFSGSSIVSLTRRSNSAEADPLLEDENC